MRDGDGADGREEWIDVSGRYLELLKKLRGESAGARECEDWPKSRR